MFQIDELLDDRAATRQGSREFSAEGVPVHSHGRVLSVIWMRLEPTAVRFRNHMLGQISGFVIVTMGP